MSENDLAQNLLDLLWPRLEELVEAKVGEQLKLFERDVWMTTEQAAAYVGISAEALALRARRGRIPAHKDGSRWLFRRDELDGFFDTARCRV